MATYAIGDIQGCYDQLQQLLAELEFKPDKDKLWFAGDIVNRGPDSLQTLRFIKSLGNNAITVLGNHDLHLLAIANGRGKSGKRDTLNPILESEDRNELLDWLIQQPLMHYDKELNVCMVHAGIHPYWSVKKALKLAAEVEDMLQGPKSHEFFHHMYGDKPPKWSDKLKGWDRLRFITNVFTRMRYCDYNGHLSLKDKGKPGKQPTGIYPWFDILDRKTTDTRIIFGHWSTLGRVEEKNLYPLDTGCLWGGKLSAIKVNKKLNKITRVKCPKQLEIKPDHGFKRKK